MGAYDGQVWGFLIKRIPNEYGVAGLMGNIKAESGINPGNLEDIREDDIMPDAEYVAAIDNGTYTESEFVNDNAGFGLCQWTSANRKQRLYTMYKEGGYSTISSILLQCNVLWYELENHFADVLEVLKNATSIREASDKVLHDFETPADRSEEVEEYRESLSKSLYNTWSGTSGEEMSGDQFGSTKRKMSKLLLYAVACDLI